jgi:uncharacterized protein YbaP (TraB family)
MKLKFLLGVLFLTAAIFAQEKKYQSLLWEVSGNGLKKKSYIYGTMHLSDKVSYHLSDAFFTHLMAADMVANESNPETWKALDEMINVNLDRMGYKKFYAQFYRYPIDKNEIIGVFDNKSYVLENLLYRTNERRKEYQEETYLDMFIHQTGRKYNKLTPSLEDVKEAYMLISNTEPDFEQPTEEKIQKITKLLKNKQADEAMVDYYREKNLDDLDELYSLILPKNYLEALLLERNRIMAKNMDSLMKNGSLFAAMGAAHIPGEEGVVNILRKKGYTVKPIVDAYTQKGKATKKKIDEFFLKPTFSTYKSEDEMIELPLNKLILNNVNGFNSPDLTNGGYINVKRTPLFDFFQKDAKKFNPKKLDSLFFENIPGNIDEKNFVEVSKFVKYYDLKNTTKSGNTQRHRFYVTPLEIIAVSMTGNGVYTKNFNEEVFKEIKIKDFSNDWTKFQNQKNSFGVEIPAFNSVYGNEKDPVNPLNTEIYAFDTSNSSYYFVIENNPGNYIVEDTNYELERIQEEFYNQIEATPSKQIKKESNSLHSQSKFLDKIIDLNTQTDGVTYFLLGCVNCNDEQKNKFFNSFTINKLKEDQDYRKLTQKEGLYSVEVPFKQNEVQFLLNKTKKYEKKKTKNTNLFESKSFENTYQSQNGSKVTVLSYQYHPYDFEKSPDSIYKNYKQQFTKDFETENSLEANQEIVEEVIEEVNDSDKTDDYYGDNYYGARKAGPLVATWDKTIGTDLHLKKDYIFLNETNKKLAKQVEYEMLVTKPNSKKAIKTKIVIKDGISYLIRSFVPKDYKNDNPFVERIFNSIQPKDTILGASIFENKIDLFLSHLKSPSDSIKNSAMKSLNSLKIDEKDAKGIEKLLNNIEINNKNAEYLEQILKKVAAIDLPIVYDFIDKTYKNPKVNANLQVSILNGLSKQKNQKAYTKIDELLKQDLPLAKNGIDQLFQEFSKNLEYSQALVPNIFEYLSIQEYHDPIIDFIKKLVEKDKINAEKICNYKGQILTNAKLEYKRILSWKNEKETKKNEEYYDRAVYVISKLNTFLHLLHPFKKDKDVNDWWQNVRKLDINETLIEMLSIDLNKNVLDIEIAEELLKKPNIQFASYCLIKSKNKNYQLPKISEEDLAKSGVLLLDIIDMNKKTLDFITEKIIDYNEHKIKFYFYKSKNIKQEDQDNFNAEVTLMSIGFVLDKNNKIIPEAFYSGLQTKIASDDKLEIYYKQVIEKSLHEYKEEATFGKVEKENFEDMYMDY